MISLNKKNIFVFFTMLVLIMITIFLTTAQTQTLKTTAKASGHHENVFTTTIKYARDIPSGDVIIQSLIRVTGQTGASQTTFTVINEYVGIMTNNPGTNLDVLGNVIIQGNLDMRNNRITNYPYPASNDDLATKKYIEDSVPWIQSGEHIYYNSGRVGIGTSSPGYDLDVSGNIRATGYYANTIPGTDQVITMKTASGGTCSLTIQKGIVINSIGDC